MVLFQKKSEAIDYLQKWWEDEMNNAYVDPEREVDVEMSWHEDVVANIFTDKNWYELWVIEESERRDF